MVRTSRVRRTSKGSEDPCAYDPQSESSVTQQKHTVCLLSSAHIERNKRVYMAQAASAFCLFIVSTVVVTYYILSRSVVHTTQHLMSVPRTPLYIGAVQYPFAAQLVYTNRIQYYSVRSTCRKSKITYELSWSTWRAICTRFSCITGTDRDRVHHTIHDHVITCQTTAC